MSLTRIIHRQRLLICNSATASVSTTVDSGPPVDSMYPRPINTEGGQCRWCGTYGHTEIGCPLLK
ncbi:hypothetical protein BX666DRAFT_1904272 [Dichotomocladium elegans]|nr:hypothetical protein BX666DRAFT_1904272 [Dichotomocladium elegans]